MVAPNCRGGQWKPREMLRYAKFQVLTTVSADYNESPHLM
jgi:hypothetical protein